MPIAAPTAHRRRTRSTTVDHDRIRGVVAFITSHPGKWRQTSYYSSLMGTMDFVTIAVDIFDGADIRTVLRRRPDGNIVLNIAARILGLSQTQLNKIVYFGHNSSEHPSISDLQAFLTETTGVHFP